jgi:hypothetical protein
MVDGKSVVTQAHEIQCMVKELALLQIIVPDDFVARGIIVKFPSSWRDFATALKHKRVHMSILDLIVSLDVKEKARAKMDDLKELRVKSIPTWCTSRSNMTKAKTKLSRIKSKQTTTFKKKKKKNKEDGGCFVCGSPDHWAKKCLKCKGRRPQPKQKTVNMVVSRFRDFTSGHGNLPYVLSMFQSTTWWLDSGANVHVCSDASQFFSYQVARDSSVMMENGSHASVHGVGTVDLKLT